MTFDTNLCTIKKELIHYYGINFTTSEIKEGLFFCFGYYTGYNINRKNLSFEDIQKDFLEDIKNLDIELKEHLIKYLCKLKFDMFYPQPSDSDDYKDEFFNKIYNTNGETLL